MSITQQDLNNACQQLISIWARSGGESKWQDVRIMELYGIKYMRITKAFPLHEDGSEVRINAERADESLEDNDSDPEALARSATVRRTAAVIFDIIHSPSYQVPVLYLTTKGLPSKGLPTLDGLYQMLVPASSRAALRNVGPLGAVSMTEHPATGAPTYFIHPCSTQEAMHELTALRVVSPAGYLMLWFGLIGRNVGLDVPLDVGASMLGGDKLERCQIG